MLKCHKHPDFKCVYGTAGSPCSFIWAFECPFAKPAPDQIDTRVAELETSVKLLLEMVYNLQRQVHILEVDGQIATECAGYVRNRPDMDA